LRSLPARFDPGGAVTLIGVRVALMQGDYDDAADVLARSQRDWLNDTGLSGMAGVLDGYVMPRSWFTGLIAQRRGDRSEAKRYFELAYESVRQKLTESPDDAKAVTMIGLILAELDQKEEAVHQGERAAELLPVASDAVDGPLIATNLAAIYTTVGEHERAIAQLRQVTGRPAGPTRGLLDAEPEWAPLRTYPVFQQLV
jgi:tetratricopeptide (TPR) repeat protein